MKGHGSLFGRAWYKAHIRGLRAVSDYEYEIQLFLANKYLNSQVETV